MLTDLQKRAAQAIVNIFETGLVLGEYERVTLLPNDPGHLTYGRAQTTLASGNLHLLIKNYCAQGGKYASALKPYLPRLAAKDFSLDRDAKLKKLLQQAGADSAMHQVQDDFFDGHYWAPACKAAMAFGFSSPLAVAVIYDSLIHGSWAALRDMTNSKAGLPQKLGEKKWIAAYVETRRSWLATHANALLRKTIYRMDSFAALIKQTNWQLSLPLDIRGTCIDEKSLDWVAPIGEVKPPAKPIQAPASGSRLLRLTNPPLKGDDVKALEKALSREGYAINIDGVFDEGLEQALKAFQEENGLVADGTAGPATCIILGI
jgi:chitosanase